MKTIKTKLGNMRKSAEFVVYPRSDYGNVKIQSSHRTCLFDADTGKGWLSRHVANYPTFLHCNPVMGGTAIIVPQEVIDEALAAEPKIGDKVCNGICTIVS